MPLAILAHHARPARCSAKRRNKITTTKRSLPAALLGSIVMFLVLAFLPSRMVQGRSARPQQAVDPHVHATTPANMIDGSIHPEMIQDKDAYRLFLQAVALGPYPTIEEKNRQRATLAPADFSDTEMESVSSILTEFKFQYEDAIQRWNATAEAELASNTIPNITPFLLERDAVVQSAKQKLESAVSPQSMARFHAHVQGEKSRMKVAMEGAQ